MDVLSDVITTLRTGEPGGARVRWRAPWGVRFPDEPGTAGFLVMLQGSAWLLRDGAEPAGLGPGDVVLSPRGHGYAFSDRPATPVGGHPIIHEPPADDVADEVSAVTLCGGYLLDPDRTHPLLHELPDTIHVPARGDRHPRLRTAVEIVRDEIDGRALGSGAILPMALDMLLLYALRAWFEDFPYEGAATGWAVAMADQATSASLNAIHDDPAHPWTVQELADRARLSRAAFSRRFSALVGQPPQTYLRWWRMTTAAGQLRDSTDPLAAIASRVGYTSEFAFANAFKRHYGLAPGQFRRQRTSSAAGAGSP